MCLLFLLLQLNTEWTQIEVIDLENDGSGLGFGIFGGRSSGVIVKTILPGGVACRVSHQGQHWPESHDCSFTKILYRLIYVLYSCKLFCLNHIKIQAKSGTSAYVNPHFLFCDKISIGIVSCNSVILYCKCQIGQSVEIVAPFQYCHLLTI